eukprot:c19613_g1_i1 orf=151-1344(-)
MAGITWALGMPSSLYNCHNTGYENHIVVLPRFLKSDGKRHGWEFRVHSRLLRWPQIVMACSPVGGGSGMRARSVGWDWKSLFERIKPQEEIGERVMRMIAGSSSAPIAQYVAYPITPLHGLDPRVKQAWLLALVIVSSRSHMAVRIGLVVLMALISIWALPCSSWKDQLGRVSFLSIFLLITVSLGTDGIPPLVQTRTPPPVMDGLPTLSGACGGYCYVLWKFGPLQLTRKGLSLGITASCLFFTVLQSVSLCLTTTTPEHLAAALAWYLAPFSYFGAPVDEMVLTLLLSLRFIGLVFDEVRNIALSIVSRDVHWKEFTLLETLDVFFLFLGRVFKNLFNHAEQIAQAMVARGFKGDASKHRIYFMSKFSIHAGDLVAIFSLAVIVGLAMVSDFCFY